MYETYPEVDALDGRTIRREDGKAYAIARPKTPVTWGWTSWCPACDESGRKRGYGGSGFDYNHEHRERPDYPRFDGTGGQVRGPSRAERNYLVLYAPDMARAHRMVLEPEP